MCWVSHQVATTTKSEPGTLSRSLTWVEGIQHSGHRLPPSQVSYWEMALETEQPGFKPGLQTGMMMSFQLAVPQYPLHTQVFDGKVQISK